MRVGANSPSLWPTICSLMKTGTLPGLPDDMAGPPAQVGIFDAWELAAAAIGTAASKAGVIAYCESLRVELSQTGVKVVTIAPGFIQTPMTAHNPYKMPFLMPVDRFAVKAAHTIDQGISYRVIPWQMGCVAKLLATIPDPVYDYFAVRRKRKPRLG